MPKQRLGLRATICGQKTGGTCSRLIDDTRRERGVRQPPQGARLGALRAQRPGAAHLRGRRLAEEPITLKELADEFGVSRERVRQIGVCAFEKVQKSVKNRVAVMEIPAPLPALHMRP
jgi:hypothetical protein